MKKIFTFLIILSISISLFAAFTIEELEGEMLRNNPTIRSGEETVNLSLLDVKDAKANFSPQISLSGSFTYMSEPIVGPIIMEGSDILSQMGMGAYADKAPGYVTLYDGMDNTMYMGTLSLTQPLVTWGKLFKAVDLYENIYSAQSLKQNDSINQLKAELRVRVWSLKYLDEMKGYLNRALELSNELVNLSEEAYKDGMLLKQDWLNARIQAMEIEVKEAELESQDSMVLEGLSSLLGNDLITLSDITFEEDESFLRKYEDSDIDALIEKATGENNNNLQALKSLKSAYTNQKEIAERSMYGIPDFALQVDFSYSSSRLPISQTGWKQNDRSGFNLSIGFKTNLWDGGKAINNLSRAKTNIKKTDADYDSAISQIRSAVKSNYNSYKSTLTNLDYLLLKKENSEMELEIIQTEMEYGQKSRSDELEKLLEIETINSEITAGKITLVQNIFTLDYLMGEDFS